MSDALDLVVEILRQNWDPEIISKPIIDYSHNILDRQARALILVYRVSKTRSRADLQYNFENTLERISLDIRLNYYNFVDFQKLVNEAVRCLYESRKDPDLTYHLITIVSETEHNEPRAAFRKVIDVEVEMLSTVIQT